jgi:hypothetical protein
VLSWDVEVSPGGPIITLNGTIEEVHAQLTKINPNHDAEFALHNTNKPAPGTTALKKRADGWQSVRGCSTRWEKALSTTVDDMILGLDAAKGKPNEGPGPGTCGQVSCKDDNSIWWCNDVKTPLSPFLSPPRSSLQPLPSTQQNARQTPRRYGLDHFYEIADGARLIRNECSYATFEKPDYYSGQVFRENWEWNVIVRKGCYDPCKDPKGCCHCL